MVGVCGERPKRLPVLLAFQWFTGYTEGQCRGEDGMTGGPRFLVVDGYTSAARAELAAGGASVAGDLYAAMIGNVLPARHPVFPAQFGRLDSTGTPGGRGSDFVRRVW